MLFGFCLLIVIYILYVLLIRGTLWKIILAIFGWFGMFWFLSSIKGFQERPLDNNTFTWAMVIPTVIVLLCMITTKDE